MQNLYETNSQNTISDNDVIIDVSTKNKVLGKTFFWMFLGLLGSGLVAFYTYYSGLVVPIIYEHFNTVAFLEIFVVLLFSLFFRKLPATAVGVLFFLYSMINGLTLSVIFLAFELSSIFSLFIVSALAFGALAFIGYKTDKDLSSWGVYISVFLLASIIISIINIVFLKSSRVELVLDFVVLIVFFAATIYDLNRFKILENDPSIDKEKIHIYFAMELYLDFINIFLRMLSLFGKRRD